MGNLLIVEDDAAIQRTFARIVTRYCVARFASSTAEAFSQIANRNDWCGFVVDLGLGTDPTAGFEVLEHVRRKFPDIPAVVVTGRIDVAVVNRAATLDAVIIGKPFGEAELSAFLRKVIARSHEFTTTFSARLESLAHGWRLSPREYEIVAWLVAGGTRDGYLTHNGMAATTFRTHMKHILQKAKASSFAELLSIALRRIFAVDQEPISERRSVV